MTRLERAENVALGLSVLGWGVLGEAEAAPEARSSVVRLTLTALNVCVGLLFLARAPVLRRASPLGLLASVPSVLAGGIALGLAPPPEDWPRVPAALFALGGVLAVAALASLGRAFAILPAVRGVVARGPYRWVRHPAYAGELVMIAACAMARADLAAAAILAAATALAVARIFAEERMLAELPAYGEYARRVPNRLVPWLW